MNFVLSEDEKRRLENRKAKGMESMIFGNDPDKERSIIIKVKDPIKAEMILMTLMNNLNQQCVEEMGFEIVGLSLLGSRETERDQFKKELIDLIQKFYGPVFLEG